MSASNRKLIKKLAAEVHGAIGGPFEDGQRKFTEYVEAVLDYIDESINERKKRIKV